MGCHSSRAPPPEEFRAAVGTWKGAINSEGATVTFVLFGDGSFFYGKQTKHSSVSTQGPINQWSGSGTFDSKLCCCSSHFELENPVDEGDGLTMVVNGVKLSYAGLPSVPSTQSSNQSF